MEKPLFDKPTVSQLVKKFPAFYGTRKFTTVCTTARHLSLYSARSIMATPSSFLKTHFNTILQSTPRSSHSQLSESIYGGILRHFATQGRASSMPRINYKHNLIPTNLTTTYFITVYCKKTLNEEQIFCQYKNTCK